MRFNYINLQLFGGSGNSSASSRKKAGGGSNNYNRIINMPYENMSYEQSINYIKRSTNMSDEEAEEVISAMEKYTGDGYRDIRAGKDKKTEQIIENYIERSSIYGDDMKANLFGKDSGKWQTDVYRGIRFKNETQMNNFLNEAKNGSIIDMKGISSWSSDKDVARKFSSGYDYSVMFTCKNKSGTGISFMSSEIGESEILMSGKSRFRIKNIQINGNSNFKKVNIELEEV